MPSTKRGDDIRTLHIAEFLWEADPWRATELRVRIDKALADAKVRSNIRRAMDGLMDKRLAVLPDPVEREGLRDPLRRAQGTRPGTPARAARTSWSATARRNGIQVHWAETTEEANRICHQILAARGARTLVKGKSMVSEEMGLNHYLEARGIEVLESDLGEFILQLADEPPVAHHRPGHPQEPLRRGRRCSARSFRTSPTPRISTSCAQNAREVLRRKFYAADAGLSGVNFAVAETGTLCLVENEGNGRMCTTVPPLHIAVTGIEKVVEKLEHVPPLLSLLTRSATGQPITTYFNMISGPRKPGEKDGPEEVHLVLLDNGRSRMYADPELQATLRCIRCGACMNHCPVYARVGGHAYGTVYPGPIGMLVRAAERGPRPARRADPGLHACAAPAARSARCRSRSPA